MGFRYIIIPLLVLLYIWWSVYSIKKIHSEYDFIDLFVPDFFETFIIILLSNMISGTWYMAHLLAILVTVLFALSVASPFIYDFFAKIW